MPKTPYTAEKSYMSYEDFVDEEIKLLTIDRVFVEDISYREDTFKADVIHWKEPGYKPLVLNASTRRDLQMICSVMDDLSGVQLVLYTVFLSYLCGRVIRFKRAKPMAGQIIPACTDCGNSIQDDYGKSAEWWARYTAKRFGSSVCRRCWTKRTMATMGREGLNR